MQKIITNSEEETFAFAENLAVSAVGGEVFTLKGELGAGKTVFSKGFARGLGVLDAVTSPTFTIMNEYEGERLKLYHFDAYRLRSGEEAFDAGLVEFFGEAGGVCLIEWADNIASVLPKNTIKIEIEYVGENSREITIYD